MAIRKHPVYPTQPEPLRRQLEHLLEDAEPVPIEGEVLAVVERGSHTVAGRLVREGYATTAPRRKGRRGG